MPETGFELFAGKEVLAGVEVFCAIPAVSVV